MFCCRYCSLAMILPALLYLLVCVDAFSPLAFTKIQRGGGLFLAKTYSDKNAVELINTRRGLLHQFLVASGGGLVLSSSFFASPAVARLDPVNRPDLLPSQAGLNIIQTEKFLATGQAKRVNDLLTALERDTGFRFRVVCQNYPITPGLAIRDYWSLGKEDQKDDLYVVMIVDEFGGKGNVLNFNVGEGLKLNLPTVFLRRLQSKYGTKFYVQDNGIDLAVINAAEAIATCLRSEEQFCVDVPDAAPSMRSLGLS